MKIKASYESEPELLYLLKQLSPNVIKVKHQPESLKSPYKRVYIDLKPP